MKDERVLELYQKMVDAYEDYSKCKTCARRAPTVGTMAKYINHVFGKFGFVAKSEKTSDSGHWLHSTYIGTKVVVKLKKKEVYSFSNTFGEPNAEFAKYILCLHKEYLTGIERELKIRSIIGD